MARHSELHDVIDRLLGISPLRDMIREGVTGASRLQCCPSFGPETVCTLIYREDDVDIHFAKASLDISATHLWHPQQLQFATPPAFSRQTTIRRGRLPPPLRMWSHYRDLALTPFDYPIDLDGITHYHSIYDQGEVISAKWRNLSVKQPEHAAHYAIVSAFEKLIGWTRSSESWGEVFDHMIGRLWFLWW